MRMTLGLLFIAAASLFNPNTIDAAELTFEVHNLSNSPVYVAIAYTRGKVVSGGWTKLETNEEKTYKADWARGMHLRIHKNGKEIRYSGKQYAFSTFPVCKRGFRVSRTDNPSIHTFKWGKNPTQEFNYNKKQGGPLPEGWSVKRFFTVRSPGKYHFEVLPAPFD